jgi:hypothetical protein
MSRFQTVLVYLTLGALFLALLAAAILRSVADPDGFQLWEAFVAFGGGILFVFVIAGAVWLPGRLTYRAVQRLHLPGPYVFAYRDRSFIAILSEFDRPDPGLQPNVYATITITQGTISVWAGGLDPRRVIEISHGDVLSVATEYGPFGTFTPITYIQVTLRSGAELNFVPYGRAGLLPLSPRSSELLVSDVNRSLQPPASPGIG